MSERLLPVLLLTTLLTACGADIPRLTTAPATSSALQPRARGVKLLYSFLGSPDGADPWGALTKIPRSDAFIGTTQGGGDSRNDGTIYTFSPGAKGQWSEKVLYTFSGEPDGSNPSAAVQFLKTTSGTVPVLTTSGGGTNEYGAVVSVSLTGQEKILYSFAREPDGNAPHCPVVADKNGDLFGTTQSGGSYNLGAVWELQPQGSSYRERVIYSFNRNYDGNFPYAGLLLASKGALFGTTPMGGKRNAGTVFQLKPSSTGYTETIIHSFGTRADSGMYSFSGLTADSKGNLYGTTENGGNYGYGEVYQLSSVGSAWTERTLWNLGSSSSDGDAPYLGDLGLDEKGDVYGTAQSTGNGYGYYQGTFFILIPSGKSYKETTFDYSTVEGAYPIGGPTADDKGNVYVATSSGGPKGHGTIGVFSHKLLPGKMKNP
jgi:uncharacterized repeat protein (TIGR03803 family)